MRGLGYLLIIATALMWSTNGPTARLAFDAGITPNDLAAMRVLGSALLFGAGAVMALRRLSRRDLLLVGAFGACGIMLAQYFYYQALDRIDVAVAIVIVYMNPLVVAVFQRVRFGERLPGRAQRAMALAIGGVVLMVAGSAGGIGRISTLGILMAIGTMLAASIQIVLAGHQPRSLTPVQRTGAGMMVAGLIWLVVNPVWTIPWGDLGESASLGPRLGGQLPLLLIVLWITVMGTALPYVTLVAGAARIGAGATSVVTMVEPAVASILAWIVLGQSLEPLQIVGIVAALAGVFLVEQARMAHTPVVAAAD